MAEAFDQALESALREVTEQFDINPLVEPARATALVADLTASASSQSAVVIISLRQVLQELSTQPSGPIVASDVAKAAIASGAARDNAADVTRIATSVLGLQLADELGKSNDDERREPVNNKRLRMALLSIIALATIAVGTFVVVELLDDGESVAVAEFGDSEDGEEADDESQAEGGEETPAPTPDPATETSASGFTVTFPSVAEGEFLVDRGWRVTTAGDEFIGIVRLSSNDNSAVSGLHQELVPGIAGDGASIAWDPPPATAINRVARFNISLDNPGDVLEIEFRTPISTEASLTEADLFVLFEEWSQEVVDLRPLGASDELLQPVITSADG